MQCYDFMILSSQFKDVLRSRSSLLSLHTLNIRQPFLRLGSLATSRSTIAYGHCHILIYYGFVGAGHLNGMQAIRWWFRDVADFQFIVLSVSRVDKGVERSSKEEGRGKNGVVEQVRLV